MVVAVLVAAVVRAEAVEPVAPVARAAAEPEAEVVAEPELPVARVAAELAVEVSAAQVEPVWGAVWAGAREVAWAASAALHPERWEALGVGWAIRRAACPATPRARRGAARRA